MLKKTCQRLLRTLSGVALLCLIALPALAVPPLLVSDAKQSTRPGGVLRFNGSTGAYIDNLVPEGSGGLSDAINMVVGPDNRLYVASHGTSSVLRYNLDTGAFIDAFVPSRSGGLNGVFGLAFGPDGDLYVGSVFGHKVLRYNGVTGAFIAEVVNSSNGLALPHGLAFGGNYLFISDYDNHQILRYDVTTGTTVTLVPFGGFGLESPQGITVGPDGKVYVSSRGRNRILRFDPNTGAPLPSAGNADSVFVPSASGGLSLPQSLEFGPDGNLYVASYGSKAVLRYNPTTGAFVSAFVPTNAARSGFFVGLIFAFYLPVLEPIENVSVDVGGLATFTASATDANPDSTLTYGLEGAPTGATIDAVTGEFAWTPNAAEEGILYKFRVKATDNYGRVGRATVSIKVRGRARLKAGNYATAQGAKLDLKASLEDFLTGTPLVGRTITFRVGGEVIGSAMTSSMGRASLTYTPLLDLGTYPLTVEFGGDFNNKSGLITRSLTIAVLPTTIKVADYTIEAGASTKLRAVIRSGSGLVPNKTLVFKVDSETVGSAVSDANGVALLSYTAPLEIGTKTLTVEFAGDSQSGAGTGQSTLTLTKVNTAITVPTRVGQVGRPAVLHARLIRAKNRVGIAGKQVTFSLEGVEIGVGTTDAQGRVTLTYTPTTTGFLTLTVSLADDSIYNASSSSGLLFVSNN